MNEKTLELKASGLSAGASSRALYWGSLLIVMLGLTGMTIFFEAHSLHPGMPFDKLASYKWTTYGNLLFAVSAVIYIAHLWLPAEAVGKWATALATGGMIAVAVGLLSRWFEMHRLLQDGHAPVSNLYEVTTLFTVITVLIYLAMESVYRNRAAGAFVMPIVLSAVGFETWLVYDGQANPSNLVPALKSYWMHAHVLANFIGYAAFAVAAGMGVMYLLRAGAEKRGLGTEHFAIRSFPELPKIDGLIFKAIAIGFPVFTLATVLGAAWAYEAWGGYWSWDPKETWALIVWLTYATYFHLRFVKGWAGTRMAWWAIAGFGVTLFCFLGVNLYLSGLHSYGKLG